MGHGRRYDLYLDAANNSDRYLAELWQTLQKMPQYMGKTSLIVTTDHGRGDTRVDWTDHGKNVPLAEYIWIAVLGPDTPALGARTWRRRKARSRPRSPICSAKTLPLPAPKQQRRFRACA